MAVKKPFFNFLVAGIDVCLLVWDVVGVCVTSAPLLATIKSQQELAAVTANAELAANLRAQVVSGQRALAAAVLLAVGAGLVLGLLAVNQVLVTWGKRVPGVTVAALVNLGLIVVAGVLAPAVVTFHQVALPAVFLGVFPVLARGRQKGAEK